MPTSRGSEAGLGHGRAAQRAHGLPSPLQRGPGGTPGGQGVPPRTPAQRRRAPQAPLGAQGEGGRALRARHGHRAGGQPCRGDTRVPLRPRQPGALTFGGQPQGPLGAGAGGSPQHGQAEGPAGSSGGARLFLPLTGLFWGTSWRGAGGRGGVGAALPSSGEREEGATGAARSAPRLQVGHQLPWPPPLFAGEGPARGHGPGGATGGRELDAEAAALDAPHQGSGLEPTCNDKNNKSGGGGRHRGGAGLGRGCSASPFSGAAVASSRVAVASRALAPRRASQ